MVDEHGIASAKIRGQGLLSLSCSEHSDGIANIDENDQITSNPPIISRGQSIILVVANTVSMLLQYFF